MQVILQQVGALLVGAIATAAVPAPQPSLFQEVGNLLLGSVPTALLFLVLVIAYEFLVQGPLTATLARRRALTLGAMEEAQRAIAEAEAKTAEYAEKLRLARAEAFKLREQRVSQWYAERDAALEVARKNASQRVTQAKNEIESETAAARQFIQSAAAELGRQAARAVLPMAVEGAR